MSRTTAPRWTRREALELLGMSAAAAALPGVASAQSGVTFPKGAIIRTILKDYAPEELAGGATLFHEHMSMAPDFLPRWMKFAAETRAANAPRGAAGRGGAGAGGGGGRGAAAAPPAPAGPFFMQDADFMTEELATAKREGISCIVDGGHPDMGRDVNFLREISKRSGLPIVLGGGFYTQPFYPKEISTMSEEQVVQAIIKQVDSDPIGVFGEIGSWDVMTADERKVFRAIGKAHVQTNIPIFTHTGIPGIAALEQLDLLEDAGVKPDRVVIGHLGNLVDPNVQVHRAICKRGAYVGFDRQGGPSDGEQVPLVTALLEAGFADRLMFAADTSSANQMKRNKGDGYAKTLTVFVPKLKAAGADDKVLHQIMVDNPRKFLAFMPKRPRKG
jgi:phosphotriesterase-related protein